MALAGGQAVTWSMTLVWTLVVPRILGPSGLGLITSVWSVTAILGIFLGLGTQTHLAREMVAHPDEAPHLVGTAIVLRVVMIPVFVASVVIFSRSAHYGSEARLVLWLATGATFLTLLSDPILSAFQAKERMEYMALSDVINKSAQGVIGIVVVLVGFGVVGLTASWMVVSGIVAVLCATWIRPLVRIDLRTNFHRIWRLVRDSLPYFSSGLFYLIYLWIDTVMLALMTRPEVVGWYAAPTKLFTTLMFVPVILATAWLPRLVRAHEQDGDNFVSIARGPVELVAVLALPVCAATCLGARWAIPILYGSAFAKSVPVLVILGLTLVPMYLNIMLCQVLVAMKRQLRWTFVMAGATVVNPALNAFFIRFAQHRYGNGAIGAAISLLLTELLIVLVGIAMVGRVVLNWSSFFRIVRASGAAAGMWIAGTAALPLGGFASPLIAGSTFVVLCWLLQVATAEELRLGRETISRLVKRVRPRRVR